MIYAIPALNADDHAVLALIGAQRQQLQHHVGQSPTRWSGFLRRNTFLRALQGSNSIEGFNATIDEAAAILDDERPETVGEETYLALVGYRNAMTYVLQIHEDPHFELVPQFVRSLHFMMMSYDLTKSPGQWRPGSVYVVREPEGDRVYEGPDADSVPQLIEEFIEQLATTEQTVPAIVRAAMAHLNLTMIHPFRDGNGRMARALQTLVLAREGILSPVFCSIEEWLGRNTNAYYQVLADVGQGHWTPANDDLPWVRFCLRAHYQQASTLIKRNREIGAVWAQLSELLVKHRLPERMESALIDAAFGFRVRNSRYRAEHDISDVVASRDLKKLCDAGWLSPVGEKRGRYYVATSNLLEIRDALRIPTKAADPYDIVDAANQGELPGLATDDA